MDHLDLDATFLSDGSRRATLRELIDPAVATKHPADLSDHEIVEVVIHRLRKTRKHRPALRMLGTLGVIDAARAIKEARAASPIGRAVIDIERRLLRILLEEAIRG